MPVTEYEALSFKNVNYTVDHLHIIKDITGSFPKGEITTLVGPSGAGKTTLFRLCNGLKSSSSGEISVLGNNITSYNPTMLRRNVGIALQQATMVTGSIRKNLELPLSLRGEVLAEKEAKQLLHMVGLDNVDLKRDSKSLSGGQRQKLSIARTLINKPKILLLDEITSSLDRVSKQDIEKLIVRINQEFNTTIIWITHNLEQALRVGTYTWVMMDGQLVESGEINLLRYPKDARVKRFVSGEVE